MKTEYVYHFESVKLVEVSESGQGKCPLSYRKRCYC
jgi:hypothetical protein